MKMKDNKGFTLVELLVAMSIMGLLIIMAFPTMRAVQTNNTKKKYEAYGDTIVSAAKLYVDSYGDDLFDPDRTNQNQILYVDKLQEKDLIKDINISGSSCITDSNIKVIKYKDDYTYCLHLKCTSGGKTVYNVEDKKGACDGFHSTTVYYTYKGVTRGEIEVVEGDQNYKILAPEKLTGLATDIHSNHEVFLHWKIGGNTYNPNNIYPHAINSSITFEAVTRPWKYIINYHKSDNNYTGTMNSKTCEYGKDCVLDQIAFSRTGYHFVNWKKGSTNNTYANKANVKTSIGNNITKDGEQIALTAIFAINKCTVTFDPNGGSFGNHNSDRTQVIEYGKYMGDNPVVDGMRNANNGYYKATKTGYHADHGDAWIFGSKTFDERQSYLAQDVCDLSSGDNTATLKVNWKLQNYTITYNLGGGSATNPTTYNVNTDTFTLTNPTKTGYTFTGWTGSNGSTKQTTVTISKGSTGNKTYTANWTINTCTVIYSAGDGKFYNKGSDNPVSAGYKNDEVTYSYGDTIGGSQYGMRDARGGYYNAKLNGYVIAYGTEWKVGNTNNRLDESKNYYIQDICSGMANHKNSSVTLKVSWLKNDRNMMIYDYNFVDNDCTGYKTSSGTDLKDKHPWRRYEFYPYRCNCTYTESGSKLSSKAYYNRHSTSSTNCNKPYYKDATWRQRCTEKNGTTNEKIKYKKADGTVAEHACTNDEVENQRCFTNHVRIYYTANANGEKSCANADGTHRINEYVYRACTTGKVKEDDKASLFFHGVYWYSNHPSSGYHGIALGTYFYASKSTIQLNGNLKRKTNRTTSKYNADQRSYDNNSNSEIQQVCSSYCKSIWGEYRTENQDEVNDVEEVDD